MAMMPAAPERQAAIGAGEAFRMRPGRAAHGRATGARGGRNISETREHSASLLQTIVFLRPAPGW